MTNNHPLLVADIADTFQGLIGSIKEVMTTLLEVKDCIQAMR